MKVRETPDEEKERPFTDADMQRLLMGPADPKKQKKETGAREVPIHPDLAEIVARRMEGQSDDDEFFPERPAPPAGSQRERSS